MKILIVLYNTFQDRAENELKKLQNTIKTKQEELLELKPKYEYQKKREDEFSQQYDI